MLRSSKYKGYNMSIESWKEEFLGEINDNMSDKECLLHTKKKYEGALPENLEKHGVKLNACWLLEIDTNYGKDMFNSGNCSLCIKYVNTYHSCKGCPIDKYGINCNNTHSEWKEFKQTNDPKLMLDLVSKLLGNT